MRHGKKFNHLGRKKGHRRALMANLAAALIEHKRIQTTLAKAKALRTYLEPLVTKAKASNRTTVAENIHARRNVFRYLQNKTAVQELFDGIAAKVADRPGGYLRIIRIGSRLGDAAEMALIEFVDYNDTYIVEKKAKAGGKKKRTRRGKSKSADKAPVANEAAPEATAAATAAEVVAEAPAAVEEVVAEAPAAVEEVVAETQEVVEEVKEDIVAEAEDITEEEKKNEENNGDTTA